ncbi:MAG: anthranilate phosphoribosyltransferase [Pseudomonadota bacterium]
MSQDVLRKLLQALLGGADIGEQGAQQIMAALAENDVAPAMAGALLAALHAKGESAQEIRGFAREMRARALAPTLPAGIDAVDVVGTGGDGSGSFNLSTGAGLLAAAAGAAVVKHGNRSVSSQSGSADVLETLGVPLDLAPEHAGGCLAAANFVFLFAPVYHPAMKAVVPVRQAMGVRTVFNVLGPLTNPAQPPFQVIGAYREDVAELMAEALSGLPIERAFVVHGDNGWDEATPICPFTLFDVRPGTVKRTRRTPEDYGLARCDAADLAGGDAAANAAALQAVLHGEDTGAHADALLMGSSLVLEVAQLADDAQDGVAKARAAIVEGRGRAVLAQLTEVRKQHQP